MKVMIMAGGTGGHIFPAKAVAHCLQPHHDIVWLGSSIGMEQEWVPQFGYRFCALPVSAWHGRRLNKLWAPINLARALIECRRIFKREQPDLAIGFGGFASAPGGIMAKVFKCPLLLHEQNAIPGLTNKKLAPFAHQVLLGFPNSQGQLQRSTLVGNPVRQELLSLPQPSERFLGKHPRLRVLILGGSQGAQILNQLLPETLAMLPKQHRPEIWHQAGKNKAESTQAAYNELQLEARVEAFIENMSQAYAWADLVIARSGASTVSELAAVGACSLLMPYPWHRDQQQYHNAQWLVERDAAVLLEQAQTTPAVLAQQLLAFDQNRERIEQKAINAWRLGIRDSASQIATIAQTILEGSAA